MGWGDSIKNALGMGEDSSESDSVAAEWEEELEAEFEEEDDMMGEGEWEDENTEPEVREWDSAYRFAEEYLETRGFTSMVDFTNKAMARKVQQSPMYRDRIQTGVETMNQINAMQQKMRQLQGADEGSKSYQEQAEMLKSANEVIDQAQKLAGEEEAMVNDIMELGHGFLNELTQRRTGSGQSASVNSSVNSVDGEM